jgi:NAD(P)-dependent dehydrogenase (short-subunit alcohol dehydrogenase family)
MKKKLKPVEEQVIVITGADSGIGLATARMASRAGSRVVLNSRDAGALKEIAKELRSDGAEVAWHAGDVADERAMRELADTAVEAFGRIDTWVNNAGVSVYGEIVDVPVDDARRLFETNYFGVVNGSLAAIPHLRRGGGVLINVGSVLSDVAVPLQGHYTASKHAVKGFTDSLRQELDHHGEPISVVLIRPAAIDTPYTEHAHNHMDDADPSVPPPVYAPRVVARAILKCAERPRREVMVGGAARQMQAMETLSPRLYDRYARSIVWKQQRAEPGSRRRNDALSSAGGSRRERGDYDGHVMQSSAYTRARQSPLRSLATLAVLGGGAYLLTRPGVAEQLERTLRGSLGGGGGNGPSGANSAQSRTTANAAAEHGRSMEAV